MKITNFTVFYNRFIFPLEEIKELLQQPVDDKSLFSIKISVSSMANLLQQADWSPFPDYQSVIAKLMFMEKIKNLVVALDFLENPPKELTKEAVLNFLQKILDELMAYAHFLNLLDTTKTTLQAKIAENTSLLAKSLPAFLSSVREKGESEENLKDIQALSDLVSDFHLSNSIGMVGNCNNSYNFASKKENPASANEQVYAMLMRFLNHCSNEELQNFIQSMFSNLDYVDPNVVYQKLDMSKVNIFDDKFALQRFAIEQINSYKTAYTNFIADLQQQNAEYEVDNSPSSAM